MEYDAGAAFGRIEDILIDSMMRNLRRHLNEESDLGFDWSQWQVEQLKYLDEYRKKNPEQFKGVFRTINSRVDEALEHAYENGQKEEELRILEALANNKRIQGQAAQAAIQGAGDAFFRVNEDKLGALIDATRRDLERAEAAVLRRANDRYRKIIFDAQVYANTGAGTIEKAVDMATKDFLMRGIDCIEYKNGARHSIEDYADMCIKTAERRAKLAGEGKKRKERGESLVIVNKRGDDPCPHCAKWAGKILIDDVYSGGEPDGKHTLLSEAMAQGFLHPRCRDGFTTYFPGISTMPDPATEEEIRAGAEAEEREAREQYAVRMAKRWNRWAKYSLDPENRRQAEARAAEWEKEASGNGSDERHDHYEDITGRWYPEATPGSHEVVELMEYTAPDGTVYKVDGRNVKLDYKTHEKEIAELLEREVGGEIFMVPRINNPQGIATPDYLFNGKGYDLKTLGKDAGENTIFNRVKKAKRQANSFVIDVTAAEKINDEVIDAQIKLIFTRKSTSFVDEIVIVRGGKIIMVAKRKK